MKQQGYGRIVFITSSMAERVSRAMVATEPIASQSSDEVVQGMGRAYRRILTEMSSDLTRQAKHPSVLTSAHP